MSQYIDIDIYGRETLPGVPLEYYDEDAVKNAFTLWLTTNKGEYLMNPAEGGILDFITFKKLDVENQNKIIFAIKNSISNYFSSTIRVEKINVIPNYEIRTTEIQIKYENLETKNNDVVSIFVNSAYSVKQFTYEEVALVSDNLKSFCMIKKPEMVNKKLVFNYEFNMWIWGKYKLINLTIEDSKFDDILAICNT